MRRNLDRVKHLLDLVQAYADHDGILVNELKVKWAESGGGQTLPEEELLYLSALCVHEGLLNMSEKTYAGGRLIQMTWKGHDYLDSKTVSPQG
ncbi:hypothetical protein [Pseudomonas sp. FP2254]|uniref:hypothetical protein n=1 Tax=Pseudomonas sp. FP2254 TaxID=2954087 RepID=UPI0027364133|nr:hypothetical protein [Pseudomonas sp. FP2254]WLH42101.1 hypothetical protein PSH94_05930 [Pseudomonas sp. FP2254]